MGAHEDAISDRIRRMKADVTSWLWSHWSHFYFRLYFLWLELEHRICSWPLCKDMHLKRRQCPFHVSKAFKLAWGSLPKRHMDIFLKLLATGIIYQDLRTCDRLRLCTYSPHVLKGQIHSQGGCHARDESCPAGQSVRWTRVLLLHQVAGSYRIRVLADVVSPNSNSVLN